MKTLYAVELIKLINVSKCQHIYFSCLIIIMVEKKLIWNQWYDPKQHQINSLSFHNIDILQIRLILNSFTE